MFNLTQEDINFLKELQIEKKKPDLTHQAEPKFWVVKDIEKVYGLEDGYGDDTVITDCDGLELYTMQECYKYIKEYVFPNEEFPNMIIDFLEDENIIRIENENEEDITFLKDMSEVFEYFEDMGASDLSLVNYKEIDKVQDNTFFITLKGCKEHLEANHYHYTSKAKPYAMTAWRSPEVEKLWKIIDKVDLEELEKMFKERSN